jgi:iron complex outermembrane recepter protein
LVIVRQTVYSATALFIFLVSHSSSIFAEETYVVVGNEQSGFNTGASSYSLDSRSLEELQIKQTANLSNYLPNATIKNSQGNSNPIITIRGVGLHDFLPNNDQSANVYVDDVVLVSPAMMSFQLFDVERAEVLYGPQGNEFGRNSTAGSINYTSKKPTNEFYTDLSFGYGNYERYSADAVINGRITDTINGRLSMTGDWSTSGHFENTYTGNDYGELARWAGRGQLSWEPDNHSAFLFNLHGGVDVSDAMTNWVAVGVYDPGTTNVCAPALAGNLQQTLNQCEDRLGYQDRDNDPFTGAWDLEPDKKAYQFGVSLKADWQFEQTRLTSITAYENFDQFIEEDADGSPAVGFHIDSDYFIEQFTQEVRLGSSEPLGIGTLPGKLNWTIGGFYHFDTRVGNPSQQFNFRDWLNDILLVNLDQFTQSAAIFTNNEWRFTDQWQLVFGARYTWEEKEFFSETESTVAFGGTSGLTGLTFPVANSRDNNISDSVLTGSISLEYTPTDNLLSYFKFSKGFRGGGFSGLATGTQEQLDPYDKEELYAYELGFKTRGLNNTLRTNSAFFYYDYRDMQVFAIPFDAAVPLARLTNAEKATVVGMETSVTWQPITPLEINTNFGFIDHQIKDSRFDDNDLPDAPQFTFSNIIRYEHSISNDLTLTPMLMTSYQSDAFKSVENTPLIESDSYWLLNTRVALREGNHWELAAWANNLTDEEYIVDAFDQSGQGVYIYNYGMPRTYGMNFTYRFD